MVWLVGSAVAIGIAALLLLGVFLMPRRWELKWFTKPLSGILLAVATFAYMWQQAALQEVRGLDMFSPFGDDMLGTLISILVVWFSYAAVFTTALNEFYDFKALRQVVGFFSLPVFALTLIFFEKYAIGIVGNENYTLSNATVWLLAIQSGLGIALALSHTVRERSFPLPTRSEIPGMLLAILGAILAFTPSYAPQAIVGHLDGVVFYDLVEAHRYAAYAMVVIPFIIFHFLKDKTPAAKHFALMYLAIGGMWTYLSGQTLLDWLKPYNLPLHLCNLAMFIIAAALIFKWDKLFYFTMFINVMGALFAMLMPNYDELLNAFDSYVVYFWFNHYMAFFMPILIIALKVFERPKFKQWIYAQIGFGAYFLLVLFSNATLDAVYGPGTADFFFINGDFILDKLGDWAVDLLDITATIKIFDYELLFYPLYQFLYFICYMAISLALWFIYEVLFRIWDDGEDRRERERAYRDMRKKLTEYLGGRPITEPAGGDDSPRIVLRDFSKRYGSNKHYSVNKVSFEVKGGEIFGFLGPNGAGKSTIIKSMVGIQTITSGEIEICGYNVELQSVEAKSNIGFVPDHYALYENLTGREYVNYIADLYNVDREYRDAVIEKYVERFQLTGSFDNQMKTYSHGMKQKITIMSALVHNPKVWILDEPLTGLDPTSIHEVKECMKEHAAAGNIVFFSSHIIDVVEKLCDRIAIIKKGQLRACTSMKELADSGVELEQFYLDIIYSGEDAEEQSAASDLTECVGAVGEGAGA